MTRQNSFKQYEFHTKVCGDRLVLKLTADEAMEVFDAHIRQAIEEALKWDRVKLEDALDFIDEAETDLSVAKEKIREVLGG